MKNIAVIFCLLAATTVVRGMNQDEIMEKYMEQLLPDIRPCAEEFHISQDIASNIQRPDVGTDMKQMGCLKACVMKRMKILTGLDFHLEPIYDLIEKVHTEADDIAFVRKLATECADTIKGETDECNIGNKYTDCYVQKLFDN